LSIGFDQSFVLNPSFYSLDPDLYVSPSLLNYSFSCRVEDKFIASSFVSYLDLFNVTSNQSCFSSLGKLIIPCYFLFLTRYS
jgi:hypothetical protein